MRLAWDSGLEYTAHRETKSKLLPRPDQPFLSLIAVVRRRLWLFSGFGDIGHVGLDECLKAFSAEIKELLSIFMLLFFGETVLRLCNFKFAVSLK